MSNRIRTRFPMAVIALCLGIVGLVAIGVEAGDYHNTPLICSDCHVMHAMTTHGIVTYNAGAGYLYLLKQVNTNTLCLSCHSADGPNAITAPLIADYVGADTICGGGFNLGHTAASAYTTVAAGTDYVDSRGHDLYNSAGAQPEPPGEPGTGEDWDDGVNYMRCTTCHDQHGNANYRNLQTDPNANNPDISSCTITAQYVADNWNDTSVWQDSGVMSVTDISLFCGDCHQWFAPSAASATGVASAGAVYDADGRVDNVAGANTHHPVDFMLTAAVQTNYEQGLGAATPGGGDTYPLVNSTGARDAVFCLTCHRAHGTANNDSLRFDPTAQALNGGPEACQVCHNQ